MAKKSNGEAKAPRVPVRRRSDRRVRSTAGQASQAVRVRAADDPRADVDVEEVRRLAFELYQQRGGGHGRDRDDWFEAERLVRSRTTH